MALALVLKKSCSIQATGNLFKTAIKIDSKRPFTQILSGIKKEPIKVCHELKFNAPKRSMSGDHGKLWTVERGVSVALLGMVPVALLAHNTLLDDILAASVVIHFHWGLEANVIDYVRPIIFGHAVPKVALGLLYLVSISTLGGLIYYNHSSIGISNTVRKIWKKE